MALQSKTFIVTKEQLDKQTYELLKYDSMRIRATYGKFYKGSSAGMAVRNGTRYWLTQHSDDPDDITIEQYYSAKETRRK